MNADILEATQSYANSGLHNMAMVSSMVHNHPRKVKRSRKTRSYRRRTLRRSSRKAKKYTRRR
jgi:hypothetical protein